MTYSGHYAGARIALLTKHAKERVIAPALEETLGCSVEVVSGYDTDLLGTFTRETPRQGTQLEAAVRKARIGMELAGAQLGVASEGSFGRDPYVGMLPWDLEIVVLVDEVRGLTVAGSAQGPAVSDHVTTGDWTQAVRFAEKSGFPTHGLVARPDSSVDVRIIKGIDSWDAYKDAFAAAKGLSASGTVFIEVDLRAHANPTRMEVIKRAAEDLASRLRSHCPSCEAPGFWSVERVGGLPCSACGSPTRETVSEVWGCLRCEARESRGASPDRLADPGRCDYCNP